MFDEGGRTPSSVGGPVIVGARNISRMSAKCGMHSIQLYSLLRSLVGSSVTALLVGGVGVEE